MNTSLANSKDHCGSTKCTFDSENLNLNIICKSGQCNEKHIYFFVFISHNYVILP